MTSHRNLPVNASSPAFSPGSARSVILKGVMAAARVAGPWLLRVLAWFIATGYVLFRPQKTRTSRRFYQALFPGRSTAFYYTCAWRQFHTFADSYCDRLAWKLGTPIQSRSSGWDNFEDTAREGQGAIILTSHLGNWEIGAGLVKQQGLDMMLLMGDKDGRQVGRMQKEDLRREGLSVRVSPSGEGSPLEGVEILSALRQGGLVAIAGDLSYTDARQRVAVEFLGHEVRLPSAPHLLALVSGAPMVTIFSWRTGTNQHAFEALPPRWVRAANRADRDRAIRESAQKYADDLRNALVRSPWQWGIFDAFLGAPIPGKKKES